MGPWDMEQNIFKFNDSLYEQREGTVIGMSMWCWGDNTLQLEID